MTNYFEEGEFPLKLEGQGLRKGRSIHDGYARGWGLEFGGIRDSVLEDPIYQQAMALALGRTIQAENCRMNLFLLAKYFLPRLLAESPGGSIFEFGSYRGGSAIFLASVCRSLGLNVKVYGLDTFEGMPPTDKGVDAHNAGDFSGVDLNELRAFVESSGLSQHLEFIQGIFEATAPALLAKVPPVLLAHIDCDVYTSVAFAWEAVKPYMAIGGYVAFDDAHMSSCLGATEAVEDLAIRRDGLNCEQIWPHFVFRIWPPAEHAEMETDEISEHALLEYRFRIQRLEGELAQTSQNSARVQQRDDQCLVDLGETRARLEQTLLRLKDLEAAHADLNRTHARIREMHDQCLIDLVETRASLERTRLGLEDVEAAHASLNQAHGILNRQVSMARTSRWLRLGRLLGVGPEFDIPE